MIMPREKLLKYGSGSLTADELIAILLRTGTPQMNVLKVSEQLYSSMDHSLYKLQQAPLEKIKRIKGMGQVKAITLKASLELGVRLYKELVLEKRKIKKPSDIFKMCLDMSFFNQETVRIISVDSKSNVISVEDITRGTANASLIHPREVFKPVISNSAVSFAVVHNHPSGDPTPSEADRDITERLKDCSKIMGIDIIDHIIIGKGRFYSFTLKKELHGGANEDAGQQQSGLRQIAEA
ncbi:MAG: repair protein RadC [Thermotogaceae bacterium]|jgi:DNA repair protein RadC|nr:repair protein RadC [Thermotogaceae bacterium]